MSPSFRIVPALALVATLVGGALFALRPAARELRGDEGTYVAMIASLARDFDLRFDERDLAWAVEKGGVALILERADGRVAYSKPILYPLAAAPFALAARLWGGGGWAPAFANALFLLGGLLLARRWLPIEGDGGRDLLLTFAATGIVLVYVPWRMTESLQVGLALGGLALTFAAVRGRAVALRSELFGAALLGLLVSLREPNALVAAAPIAAALAVRQPARAARLAAATAAAYLAVVGLTVALTGAPNPYKAPRSTFNAETGYPAGAAAVEALARFDRSEELATSTLSAKPVLDPARSAYAALYFLVGRHTGLLWYLPATAILLAVALSGADRPGRVALGAFAALALFYVVWMPANYFGGETFVGNRYILAGAALPLFALTRFPGRRALALAWAIAAVGGASALLSVARTRGIDATSQSHASAGLFRLLPYESTASNLDGRRDRYWSNDFVRFVDPYAEAGPSSFTLRAGAPPAELEIATRRDSGAIHWIARADAPDVTLEIFDWGRRQSFRLPPRPDGSSGGPLEFRPSPAWRRHPYWWNSDAGYATRLVRLRATSGDGRPVALRLRYVGPSAPPTDGFAREVVRLALPGEAGAVAGGSSRVELALVNRGTWIWSSEAAVPVQLGLRFRPLAASGAEGVPPIEARVPLPHPVKPGESVAIDFDVRWPEAPGRYRATLDLVLEDVAWFSEKVGEPIASAEIEVSPKSD